ncbi:MAG: hypothetical protein ACXAEU_06775 [Candidatus Hodarchaeales archaeon]
MTYDDGTAEIQPSKIPEELLIADAEVVSIFFHEKKQELLEHLIQNDLTIMDLKRKTNINPGTIKRYLDDLMDKKLVFLSQTVKNQYGFTLKYYRAAAKRFHVKIEFYLPPD